MITAEERLDIERSIIGTFACIPKFGFDNAKHILPRYFHDKWHRDILENVHKMNSKGLVYTNEQFWSGRLETDAEKAEMTRCLMAESVFNFKLFVDMLKEDDALNQMGELGVKLQDKVTGDTKLIPLANEAIATIESLLPEEADDYIKTMAQAIDEIKTQEVKYKEYVLNWDKWDNTIPITPQSIWILAGNEGTFKTKLMLYITRKILVQYSDQISIQWFSMEDPRDKLLRGYIAQNTFLTDEELRKDPDYIKLLDDKVKSYDIEFINKSMTITDIGKKFKQFRSKRKDKFCILIVDNIMKIKPLAKGRKGLDMDEDIIREVDSWNIKTDINPASVFLLHHFTKEAMDSKNEFKGYEPSINMMRGGGRYKDTATHVLLANPVYSYPSIVRAFKGHEKMMEHYYKLSIAKNRNGKKDSMSMLAYAEFNHFYML